MIIGYPGYPGYALELVWQPLSGGGLDRGQQDGIGAVVVASGQADVGDGDLLDHFPLGG
jgi:hypothetical protein